MKTVIRFLIGVAIGASFALLLTMAHAESRFSKVVDKTINSVVKISVVSFYQNDVQAWTGSGVLLSSNGHILTCEHVIEGYPIVIDVRFHESSGTIHKAIVLRRDHKRDLALLKLVDYSTPTPSVHLTTAPVVLGDEVLAIGMPLHHDWSVTAGIVSGLNREGLALNLLQTDAAINPGNSGGPLFNLQGDVIGINESGILSASNMGFSVPVSEIRQFLAVFDGMTQVMQ